MSSPFDIPPLNRRAFARFVAAGFAAGTFLTQTELGFATTPPVENETIKIYSFYPLENGELTRCNSCLSHARHKRFATLQAADENRAHPGCNCSILEVSESAETYRQMFGGTGETVNRLVYDLRQSPVS